MGCKPKTHRLDNEFSNSLKNIIKGNHAMLQLAPPHIHRRNLSERSIRTFKEHLIAGLVSTDPGFLMYLWCRLISQAEMTFNMMRALRVHPKILVYNESMELSMLLIHA